MAKIDELKEIKSDLKEVFKAILYLILGLLTAITTLIYQILIYKVPAFMILFGGLGLMILFLVALYALKLWNKMQELNEEMKNV